ncbi:septum formation family protein [Mycobacterium sp.]|uniref:septum formation family protein n=1 Tax=Mycobacterium sp. TaxID=1785 RepID=UPI003C75FC50
MSEAPEQQQPSDSQPSRRWLWWRSLQATATRRALLLTALGGLLIAGVTTALPAGANDAGRLVGHSNAVPEANRASRAFDNARPGDCLNWPNKEPDQATVVDCKDEHRFEVATSVDMRMFPGSEYGPNAAAPSAARVQQISQEQCQAAIKRYLGTKYDPNSKFTIGMLWSGTKAWSSGDRQMLCGLQLPGGGNEEQQAVKGRVADLDQSKVWQAGTCLGIDTAANQPTDIPIDCAGPHAMEVTGSVNVAEKFPGGALPPEADQDAYIKDTCTRMTDAYLAPVELRTTTLTLVYSTVSLPSWSADSHQVSCSIGATLGNGGWATLVGSAKGALLINGQPPVPPPDIPAERLNIPPIPMPMPTTTTTTTIDTSGSQSQLPQQTLSPTNAVPTIGNQHLPNAPGPQTVDSPAPAAPVESPAPAAPPQPEPVVPPPFGAPPPAPEPILPPAAPAELPPPPA